MVPPSHFGLWHSVSKFAIWQWNKTCNFHHEIRQQIDTHMCNTLCNVIDLFCCPWYYVLARTYYVRLYRRPEVCPWYHVYSNATRDCSLRTTLFCHGRRGGLEQNSTEQYSTEQNRTEQNRTEQNRTEQNRTEQNIFYYT